MKFVVIEGLDGSGKSTQIKLLRNYLSENNIKYRYLHFPRPDAPVYGELISRFLRGEFGEINKVDPYLVALIYAGDRNDASEMIRTWMNENYFVLADRYVFSNIAYQGAKLHSAEDKKKISDWIIDLEYGYNKIPAPDLNIYLDVPFDFVKKQLSDPRTGEDREYLKGARDIHETDLGFQGRVRDMYHSLSLQHEGLKLISCSSEQGDMLPPEKIFSEIRKLIFNKG